MNSKKSAAATTIMAWFLHACNFIITLGWIGSERVRVEKRDYYGICTAHTAQYSSRDTEMQKNLKHTMKNIIYGIKAHSGELCAAWQCSAFGKSLNDCMHAI